jgi:hypothetical protein
VVLAGRHFVSPISSEVRVGAKRRENVTAALASENVDIELRENCAVLHTSTHQAAQRRQPQVGAIDRFAGASG